MVPDYPTTASAAHYPIAEGGCSVIPVSTVCDLSIYIDSNLSMRLQVKHTLSRCFASLRGLRQIRRCVPPATVQMMVVALAHSKLDYGNGVLVGLPVYLMRQLQSVFNAAAQLSFRLKSSDHITDALISLHWLRVPERIHYKLAVMAYKVLTKCYMDVHQVTSGHLSASPMCLVGELSAPPAQIASNQHFNLVLLHDTVIVDSPDR